MPSKKISHYHKFLVDNGLLFEINRKVLHPLGLSLELSARTKLNGDIKFDFKLWDCRNDPEGILFSKESFELGKEKYEDYLKENGKILSTRQEILGYLVQEEADE